MSDTYNEPRKPRYLIQLRNKNVSVGDQNRQSKKDGSLSPKNGMEPIMPEVDDSYLSSSREMLHILDYVKQEHRMN